MLCRGQSLGRDENNLSGILGFGHGDCWMAVVFSRSAPFVRAGPVCARALETGSVEVFGHLELRAEWSGEMRDGKCHSTLPP